MEVDSETFVFSATNAMGDQHKNDPPDKGPRVVNAVDHGEELHGDWLVVRRRKKWGNDKRKELNSEKIVGSSNQSLAGGGKNLFSHLSHDNDKTEGPHEREQDSYVHAPRAKGQEGNKKRARKDTSHVSNPRIDLTSPKGYMKDTSMHATRTKDVELSKATQRVTNSSGMSVAKNVTKGNGKNQVATSEKAPVQKGFDLGPGIAISPNLLGGISGWNWSVLWTNIPDDMKEELESIQILGFADIPDDLMYTDMWTWIRDMVDGARCHKFLAVLWWVWRWRNMDILGTKTWGLDMVSRFVQSTMQELLQWFGSPSSFTRVVRSVAWEKPAHQVVKLNVDRSFRKGDTKDHLVEFVDAPQSLLPLLIEDAVGRVYRPS
ncbi:hypothetical protein RIF29_41475 [Crotalaria pallida]|uniref:Uncharacterized protein n=1 Tax=Crotalaria pallida TaxID=3830 RepID=A0AAN9E5R9_CROPI